MNISFPQSGTVLIGQVDKNLPPNPHEPGTRSWATFIQAHAEQPLTAPAAQVSAVSPVLCTAIEHAIVSLYVFDPVRIETASLLGSIF